MTAARAGSGPFLGGRPLRGLAAVLLVSTLPTLVSAETTFGARLQGAVESLGAAETADGGADGKLSVERSYASGRGSVAYTLQAGTYASAGDWSFLAHELAVRHGFPLSGERLRLDTQADARWRDNGSAWSTARYRSLGGGATLDYRPRETATLRAGYRLDGRSFPDLPELDQIEHDAFAGVVLNLPSRTTLLAEAHIGRKTYDGAWTVVTDGPVLPTTTGGRGRGRGSRGQTVHSAAAAFAEEAVSDLLSFRLRLAQSLGDKTGAWVQLGRRVTSGDAPPAVVTTPALFFADGVYDDPFASEETEWRAGARQLLGGGGSLEVGLSRSDRDFAFPALDAAGGELPGAPLRSDRVFRGEATLRLPLLASRTGAVEVDVALGYGYTRSRSTDALYDYRSHGATLGLVVTR